jgi:hypothetical protein
MIYLFIIAIYSSFLLCTVISDHIDHVPMSNSIQRKFPILLTVVIFLAFIMITTSTGVYAQQKIPSITNLQKQSPSPSTSTPLQQSLPPASSSLSLAPKLHAVKILSPTKGQQVSIDRDLTITGTSLHDAASTNNDCRVVIGVNQVKPYQSTTAMGPRGANDYSKWNFLLTSKYTTLKEGPINRITAKYACANNSSVSYSSVNITGTHNGGVAGAAATARTRSPSSTSSIASTTPTNPTILKPHLVSTNNATIVGHNNNSSSLKKTSTNSIKSPISSHGGNLQSSVATTSTANQSVSNNSAHPPSSLSSNALRVKITSPIQGQQIATGKQLNMTGISSDNAATDCKVYAGMNTLKPYQPTMATGPGGATDYSTWRFTSPPVYQALINGTNKITAELTCYGSPSLVKYDTLNVTGVAVVVPISASSIANTIPLSNSNPTALSSSAANNDGSASSSTTDSSNDHTKSETQVSNNINDNNNHLTDHSSKKSGTHNINNDNHGTTSSNGLAHTIMKSVQNNLKKAGINVNLG